MERVLQQVGLSGYGQLACYWIATWVLGFLMYHWQLGLQLLPVAAASLALSAVAGMQPLDSSSSSSSAPGELLRTGPAVGGGSCRSHRVDVSSSGGGGSRGDCSSSDRRWALPVWPSQAAGVLLAADCCMAGLLLCVSQLTGYGSGLLTGLLAATPRLLAVVLLLLGGQVVVGVLCRGWWGQRELRHASLLCRCWLVAAAGVLAASSSASTAGVLAAAAAWAQKMHMLLVEGPVFVLCLGSLLQPLQEQDQAISLQQQQHGRVQADRQGAGSSTQRSTPDQGISATAAAAASSPSGASALLCCLHFLLQLLVLLFVPPGPLAAAAWLPQPLQGLLVWGAHVLLCGALMQLALRAFGTRAAVGPATDPAAAAAAAFAPAIAAVGAAWGSPSAPAAYDSSGGWCGNSGNNSCSGPISCQQQHAAVGGMGTPCCSSPSPLGRKGWELALHGSHYHNSPQHYSSGCSHSSHALLPDAALGCGAVNNHGSCSSWALAGGSTDCSTLQCGGAVSGGGGAPGLFSVGAAADLPAGASATAVGVYRLLWRHTPYLLLLAAAFAGDSFITAATPAAAVSRGMLAATEQAAAASAGWAVRAAWQRCLQSCMVAGLCFEVLLMVRREVLLLLRLPLFPVAGGAVAGSGGGVAGVPGWQPPSAAAAAW